MKKFYILNNKNKKNVHEVTLPVKYSGFTLAEGATQRILARVKPTQRIAFTLAEVLITLGIIGVVAALTIPGLINDSKARRLHSQFLESYSIVQQAFKQMEADDVSLDPTTYSDGSFYKTYMNYFKGALDCSSHNAVMKKRPCYYGNADDKDNYSDEPYKTLDGKSDAPMTYLDDGQILLPNGMLILVENFQNRLWVSVDINGYTTKPNRWGYDLFTFQFVDGELKTMGAKGTTYASQLDAACNMNGSGNMNGITCAQKAKENSDYFKELIKEFK